MIENIVAKSKDVDGMRPTELEEKQNADTCKEKNLH